MKIAALCFIIFRSVKLVIEDHQDTRKKKAEITEETSFYDMALQLGHKIELEPVVPRKASLQFHRNTARALL